jgi:hypothetical protein
VGLPFPRKGGTQDQRISLINHITKKRLEELTSEEFEDFMRQIAKQEKPPKQEHDCSDSDEEPVAKRKRSDDKKPKKSEEDKLIAINVIPLQKKKNSPHRIFWA